MRKDLGDDAVSIANPRGDRSTAETSTTCAPFVFLDELSHLIDRADAADVALTLSASPRKQAVTAENDPVAAAVRFDSFLEHQREFESGSLPRHPDDPASVPMIELLQLLGTVRARGKRDRP